MNYESTGFECFEFYFREYVEDLCCMICFECGKDYYPIAYWADWVRVEGIIKRFYLGDAVSYNGKKMISRNPIYDEKAWDKWEKKCYEDIVRINITGKARVIQKWVRSTKCRAKD